MSLGTCGGQGPAAPRVTDPWVSIGPDGTAYVAAGATSERALRILNLPDEATATDLILATTSPNGGRTWGNLRALRSPQGVDRVSITADPVRTGTAYLVWQSTVGTWFTRTTDHGKTWDRPTNIVQTSEPGSATEGNAILVDSRTGRLYNIFDRFRTAATARAVCGQLNGLRRCYTFKPPSGLKPEAWDIMVMESRNRGTTWSRPRSIAEDLAVDRIGPHDTGLVRTAAHLPRAAIDSRTGAIIVVWQDARFTLGQFDEVAVSESRDGGERWTAPRRVNVHGNGAAIIPTAAFGPDGSAGVTYYQFREVPKQQRIPPADYWFEHFSARRRFAAAVRLAGPFDLTTAPTAFGRFVGDYEGLAAAGRTFHAVFVITNRDKADPTDVVTTTVRP